MTRHVTAGVLLLGLALSTSPAGPADDPYGRIWREAIRLGGGSPHWRVYPPVELHLGGPERVDLRTIRSGRHFAIVVVMPDGSLGVSERVVLWLDNLAQRDRRLLHEYLHAIHLRRSIQSPAFARRHPDSETWVREVMP